RDPEPDRHQRRRRAQLRAHGGRHGGLLGLGLLGGTRRHHARLAAMRQRRGPVQRGAPPPRGPTRFLVAECRMVADLRVDDEWCCLLLGRRYLWPARRWVDRYHRDTGGGERRTDVRKGGHGQLLRLRPHGGRRRILLGQQYRGPTRYWTEPPDKVWRRALQHRTGRRSWWAHLHRHQRRVLARLRPHLRWVGLLLGRQRRWTTRRDVDGTVRWPWHRGR